LKNTILPIGKKFKSGFNFGVEKQNHQSVSDCYNNLNEKVSKAKL